MPVILPSRKYGKMWMKLKNPQSSHELMVHSSSGLRLEPEQSSHRPKATAAKAEQAHVQDAPIDNRGKTAEAKGAKRDLRLCNHLLLLCGWILRSAKKL